MPDKVVLITGAKGGLGTHVTNAFLNSGARVIGTSPNIAATDFPHPNFHAEPAAIESDTDAANLIERSIALGRTLRRPSPSCRRASLEANP